MQYSWQCIRIPSEGVRGSTILFSGRLRWKGVQVPYVWCGPGTTYVVCMLGILGDGRCLTIGREKVVEGDMGLAAVHKGSTGAPCGTCIAQQYIWSWARCFSGCQYTLGRVASQPGKQQAMFQLKSWFGLDCHTHAFDVLHYFGWLHLSGGSSVSHLSCALPTAAR